MILIDKYDGGHNFCSETSNESVNITYKPFTIVLLVKFPSSMFVILFSQTKYARIFNCVSFNFSSQDVHNYDVM